MKYHVMRRKLLSLFLVSLSLTVTSQQLIAGVVLTFDHNPIVNFERIDQNYGDRVTSSPDASGHRYDIVNDGFGTTPNVTVAYGGSLPTLWRSGYGDLDNINFNDQDGDTSLNLTLAADAGFEVGLFSFELASFSSGGQTIQGLEVRNALNNAVLFSQASTFITGTTHNDFDFPAGIFAPSVVIDINLTGLGTLSDNIGIDNIYFVQQVPEPTALGPLLTGLTALGLMLRRKRMVNLGRPIQIQRGPRTRHGKRDRYAVCVHGPLTTTRRRSS